jgi:hypothetical protein
LRRFRQATLDADLYDDEEAITLKEVIAEVNLELTANDNDFEVIDYELLELEETLDLSNSQFLQNAATPAIECDENNNSVNYANWLEEFDKEGDYNLVELAKMFEKCL